MDLSDLAGGGCDPLEPYLAFHRRAERSLAALVDLAGRLEAGEMDERTSAVAAGLLGFFGESLPRHHEDEERTLIPYLERRIPAGVRRARFRELCEELEADHRAMHETWKRIRGVLAAVSEGAARRLPLELVQYYRAVQSIHICAEEAALHRAARGHTIVTPLP